MKIDKKFITGIVAEILKEMKIGNGAAYGRGAKNAEKSRGRLGARYLREEEEAPNPNRPYNTKEEAVEAARKVMTDLFKLRYPNGLKDQYGQPRYPKWQAALKNLIADPTDQNAYERFYAATQDLEADSDREYKDYAHLGDEWGWPGRTYKGHGFNTPYDLGMQIVRAYTGITMNNSMDSKNSKFFNHPDGSEYKRWKAGSLRA